MADLFSFGVLAYELMADRRPFAKPPAFSFEKVVPPRPIVSVPDPLNDLILRCLSFEPNERPTVRELLTLLEAVRETV